MSSNLPYQISHGRATIRYGRLDSKPQILWDRISLISAIRAPDICEAVAELGRMDFNIGYSASDVLFESFTSGLLGLALEGKVREAADRWFTLIFLSAMLVTMLSIGGALIWSH